MNIALIAHDSKKELMVQFCIAYCRVLSQHDLCAHRLQRDRPAALLQRPDQREAP